MTNEVDATGFGRCSVVNYTKDARPFMDHMSVVPVLNHTYRIPRLTHLCWTHDAVFMEKGRGYHHRGRKRPREMGMGDDASSGHEEEEDEHGVLFILPGSKRRALLGGPAPTDASGGEGQMTTSTRTPCCAWACWPSPKERTMEYCDPPPYWDESRPSTPVPPTTTNPTTTTTTSYVVPG